MRLNSLACSLALLALAPASAGATEPTPGYHPWATEVGRPKTIDFGDPSRPRVVVTPAEQPDFHALDEHMTAADHDVDPAYAGRTPDGWVQADGVVLPAGVASGDAVVDPDVIHAIEDLPGNEYPRKHTLFLNFSGGMLYSGQDNSAENKSILAKQGVYPAYTGGEQKAVSAAQAIENDVAAYGIRVLYLERPPNIVPYTMEIIGGQWTDTNIDSPAGGVAPGADCGALGQRHVVYTFASGGTSATQVANTASQEAGHAWGLDHTFNCSSVMSYCSGGDGNFSSTCDPLCEAQCQGANTAGCRLTHENFCGVGNDQQNEHDELTWLFGGNEPDVEPPFAEIVEPQDGAEFPEGASVDLRAEIGDNYGGYGWQWTITRNGAVEHDEVAYDREVDDDYRPALNLSNLPSGEWTLTIKVQDQFENVAEHSVTIVVGDGQVPGDSGGATDGPGGTGDSEGDPSSGGADDGTIPGQTGDGGDDGDKGGCACRATPDRSAWPLLALFGLFGGRALRRSRPRASS
jgi:MYXO-CTERM domain-containing protein